MSARAGDRTHGAHQSPSEEQLLPCTSVIDLEEASVGHHGSFDGANRVRQVETGCSRSPSSGERRRLRIPDIRALARDRPVYSES